MNEKKEIWMRYGNNVYSGEDLALLLDLAKDDENIQALYDAWDNAWNNALPQTKEQQEALRLEIAQLIEKYEHNRKLQHAKVALSRNTGRFRKIWYAAAAVLLLGLLIPTAYMISFKPGTEQSLVHYIEMNTQRGEIKTIVLPDQTQVTLNAESSIKYPAKFSGNERLVALSGEALFDVTSDRKRPFIVKTDNMSIKVVGTVFDVKDYNNDGLSSVSVASGKVEVGLADTKVMLEPNQQIKMNKANREFEKKTFDANKFISWTDGALYFYRTPIREVVDILNRHYTQVDIELAEGEYTNLISGEYKNSYTTEEILESIVYITNLKCKKDGNKYTLYN